MPAKAEPPMDAEGQRLLLRLPDLVRPNGKPAVLVTVFAAQGSVPRRPGARMVCRDGRLLAGTVGGGHLEDQALRDANWPSRDSTADADDPGPLATEVHEEATETGATRKLIRYPLGAKLAQCCGGAVWLHFEEIDAVRAQVLADHVHACERSGAAFETVFGDRALYESPRPLPVVVIFGAGHVAAALARVLQPLPWRVLVIDERPAWADPARFAPGTEVVCAQPLGILAAWGWIGDAARNSVVAQRVQAPGRRLPVAPPLGATRALVMTHDHALDRDVVEALLLAQFRCGAPMPRLAFVGMIGSKSKVAATRQRLGRRGVPEAELQRLVAPIGLLVDGRPLGGNAPGEIAISVAAQLLALHG
ncbi:MAG: xanthine dehydrogenase accessory protein XdhC [Deltaproteobacteria bacterium]|nr:xanthine dehydrogenase accessory protein XdhC [Deltaproteobacteria bacterium]